MSNSGSEQDISKEATQKVALVNVEVFKLYGLGTPVVYVTEKSPVATVSRRTSFENTVPFRKNKYAQGVCKLSISGFVSRNMRRKLVFLRQARK